jgi:hypothetical protein
MQRRFHKCIALCAGGILAAAFAATTAFGFGSSSTKLLRTLVRAETPNVTYSGPFDNLRGAKLTVFVPSGQKRLVKARFTADSSCVGVVATDTCQVRLIARNTDNAKSEELEPAGDGSRVFDSATSSTTGDGREAHAIDRSLRLGPGTWDIRVQWATQSDAGNTITFSIFSYHFSIDVWE